jgi:hypothetical protein
MSILKSTRLSQDRQTEYQIEYTAMGKDHKDAYRLRRGLYGTWSKWFPTDNVLQLLSDTGFKIGVRSRSASLLNDFYVGSHFNRGVFNLNKAIVLDLAQNSGVNAVCRHLYSRVKQTD